MAPSTQSAISAAGIKKQTCYLLHYLVYRDTKESLPDLSALAYECIGLQDAHSLFGPDVTSVEINFLMDCLEQHGQKMRDDEILERLLDKISANENIDIILEAARNLLVTETDWIKILVFLILGLQLCRKTELDQYPDIVDAIANGINLVADWMIDHGGWVELLKPCLRDKIPSLMPMLNNIKSRMDNVWDKITSRMSNVWDKITSRMPNVWDKIKTSDD